MAADVKPNEVIIDCPVCSQPWKAKMMPHHMGAHLLEDSWARYGKTKPSMPCMLCGINRAIGQHMADASEIDGCPISIVKGSSAAVKKPVHQCKLVGAIDYSMGSAANSTLETPCTNRPIKCPHPGCPLVIASYSMAQHYADKHSTTTMPAILHQEIQLGKHERTHVSQLLQKRRVTTVCGGNLCCPKAPAAKREELAWENSGSLLADLLAQDFCAKVVFAKFAVGSRKPESRRKLRGTRSRSCQYNVQVGFFTEHGQLLPQDLTIPPFKLTLILCPAKAQFSQHRESNPRPQGEGRPLHLLYLPLVSSAAGETVPMPYRRPARARALPLT